jgi:hypothetical protein
MTSRALVTPKVAARLAQILGMLGSAHDGEVLNAARLADQFVRQLGMTWADVILMPPAEWEAMAKLAREHAHLLTPRERDFITNVARLRRPPSDRQLRWLEDIYDRVQMRERTA